MSSTAKATISSNQARASTERVNNAGSATCDKLFDKGFGELLPCHLTRGHDVPHDFSQYHLPLRLPRSKDGLEKLGVTFCEARGCICLLSKFRNRSAYCQQHRCEKGVYNARKHPVRCVHSKRLHICRWEEVDEKVKPWRNDFDRGGSIARTKERWYRLRSNLPRPGRWQAGLREAETVRLHVGR